MHHPETTVSFYKSVSPAKPHTQKHWQIVQSHCFGDLKEWGRGAAHTISFILLYFKYF